MQIKIEVKENKILQIREFKEGSYYRYCLTPDTDIKTIKTKEVKEKAKEVWTPKVIKAYKDSLPKEDLINTQEQLKSSAKTIRDNAEIANIKVHGVFWQVREKDQSRMEKAINTADWNNVASTYTVDWILADNKIRKTTMQELKEVLSAVTQRTEKIFVAYTKWRNTGPTGEFKYEEEEDES